MSTNAPQPRTTVAAIIVSHDGARFLPDLVRALITQTYPIEQTLGVDTGSTDGSKTLLSELIGRDAVATADRSTGFGEAVAIALRHAAGQHSGQAGPDSGQPGPGATRSEWIWLLHDDCEPAPNALERLLREAARDRAVVVVGPKVLDAQDRRTLREAGVSIDRAGRRVTGIDPGEIDQGQHDHKRSVLGVSSAGMLVRRDVWDRLGGFDPNLTFFRDDLDFCWRVQAAGLRVHVATDAVLYHWELAGRRRRAVPGGSAPVIDRRNALFVLAVNLPLWVMLRTVGGCVLGSLARALSFLITKQHDLSSAYALSVLGLFAHPVRLFKARRSRAAGLAEGYYAVRIFIAPAHTLAKLAEQIAWLASAGPSSGRHHATADEPEEDAQFTDRATVLRRVFGHPGVRLFLVLLVITLIATRRLLGTSPLGGGALVPAWGGALSLWQEYLAGFHAVSIGSAAAAPPYLAVVAALGTVLGGQAWLAVDVLLLGCVPLAGITAYVATRWIVTATPARVLLAAAYALLPVATGAVAAGRLGTATAFVLLPLIAVSAGRMLTAAPRQARRAAWATGLLVGVAAAFAPLAWVFGVAFAIAALGVRRWFVAVHPWNAAIVAVTPFFLLFPWSLHLLATPSAFLSEAGLSTPGLTTHGLGATALLALSPGGPGVPPVWVTAGFVLALAALALPTRRRGVLVGGWAVAITGLLAAVALSRVSVTPPSGGQPAAGWPGVATALAALGLLLASAPSVEWLVSIVRNGSGVLPSADSASGRGKRSRRLLAGAALAGAATAPLFVGAYWVTAGVRGPVNSVSGQLLPTFITSTSTAGAQYRTLILRPDGAGLDYQVTRQGDPSFGQPELDTSTAAEATLGRQVAALGTANGADAGDPGLVLGSFGIKWVMLPAPVDPVLATRLDASVGLLALNKGPSYDLWQVTGPVGQVRVAGPSGATTVLSSPTAGMTGAVAPASGGTLILAEPYGGWTATVNGRALKPVATPVGGWAQGFALPAGGGPVSITHNGLPRLLSLILELVATLTVIMAALPGKRVDPAEEAEALAALREAKASGAGRRDVSAARPRNGAGHRAVARAMSGVDRLALGRRRTMADDGPLESPALGTPVPAAPGAETAEPAMAEAVTATATAARAEGGRGRHRGASGQASLADDPATGIDTDTSDGDIGGAGTRDVDAGGLPPARWAMADDWYAATAPAPAARQPGLPPAVPEPAAAEPAEPTSATSSRWGTGGLTMPKDPATDAGGPDDGDWLEELLRKNGMDHQPAPPEGATAERPAAEAPRTPADAERQDDEAWLGVLLGKDEPAEPDAKAEAPAPAPSRGAPDPLDTAKAWETGAHRAPAADAQTAWGTGAKSAWGTGPLPSARTGEQPAARTGAQPTFTPTGPQPTFTPTGPQPRFTPTGPRPTFTSTGGQPRFTSSGEQPAVTASGPAPLLPPPATVPVDRGTPPARSGPSPASAGTPTADKPPWESDDWDSAPARDAGPGDRDAVPAPNDLGDASKPGAEQQPAAPPPDKPERHSHRGGKHGKPGRWRGAGGRSAGDRES